MSEEESDVVFLKVDVDASPDIAQRQKIDAMPTFHLFKKGAKVDELVGASEPKLRALVAKYK